MSLKKNTEPQEILRQHYENFPVASWLLPKQLRRPITLIYAFARSADDWADEGSYSSTQRLEQLALLEQDFKAADYAGTPPKHYPWMLELRNMMRQYGLSSAYFMDLLDAFKRDAAFSPYTDYADLVSYCQKSAVPIGRLLLALCLRPEEQKRLESASDALCTALQLLNFLQDLQEDQRYKGRCTVPVDEQDFFNNTPLAWQARQVERIRSLLDQAQPFLEPPSFALSAQLRWTMDAAVLLTQRCAQRSVLTDKAHLRMLDYLFLAYQCCMRSFKKSLSTEK